MTRPPFATGDVQRLLNAAIKSGQYPTLKHTQLGLLHILISLADWRTGAIPYSKDQIATFARLSPTSVSRYRAQLVRLGLLRVWWRGERQVQYGLSERVNARSNASPLSITQTNHCITREGLGDGL